MMFEVFHGGKRYWTHRIGNRWNFWSSHKGAFYHGHIDTDDREEAHRGFIRWLPFEMKK